MAGIQTEIDDGRGGMEKLDHHDPRYWEGNYTYQPYPKMLYRATAGAGYTTPETCVVQNEAEHRRLSGDWQESPDEARAVRDKHDAAMAAAAAERNASDAKMSRAAQAEALAADRATDAMLPEVPVARKKPGRTPEGGA